VQDRVVMLVHPGDLLRAEAQGLPPQPAAHQQGTQRRERETEGTDPDHRGHPPGQLLADPGRRDAGGDQPLDVAAGAGHRHDGADGGPQRSGVGLGERPSAQRRVDMAEEGMADLRHVGMGVADAADVHDHDEVHPGAVPYGLGQRLQPAGRIGFVQRGEHVRRGGERSCHVQDTPPRVGPGVPLRVDKYDGRAGHDHQAHDHHLQKEQLGRETEPPQTDKHAPKCALSRPSPPKRAHGTAGWMAGRSPTRPLCT
jgi:hypothetical protein